MVTFNPFAASPTVVSEITDLRIYPIKSCRGLSVRSTLLTRQGLDLDRRWMFVDADTNRFITIRDVSEMTLIDTAFASSSQPSESGGHDDLALVISIRDTAARVTVPARPTQHWLDQNTTLSPVTIWHANTDGYVYSSSINSVFSSFLNRDVALVYKGPTPRVPGGNGAPRLLGREESVNFPDMMPLQIANEASIHELNRRLAAKGADQITIERFRPNIIVRGATSEDAGAAAPEAWTEDTWKTVQIVDEKKETSSSSSSSWLPLSSSSSSGALVIDVQARCARCQVPNVDPDTAVKNKREPWDTLVGYRRVDPGMKYKPCFGMLSCPRNEGEIRVGMRFEVTQMTNDHKLVASF